MLRASKNYDAFPTHSFIERGAFETRKAEYQSLQDKIVVEEYPPFQLMRQVQAFTEYNVAPYKRLAPKYKPNHQYLTHWMYNSGLPITLAPLAIGNLEKNIDLDDTYSAPKAGGLQVGANNGDQWWRGTNKFTQ